MLANCVKILDHSAPSFVITVQRVNQGTQRRKVIRAEQRPARGHPFEIVHKAPVRPRPRQAAQCLGINHAANQGYPAYAQVGVNPEDPAQPRVERVRHLHMIMRM